MNNDEEIKQMLQKVLNSPALNGGFQKLEYKFDLMADDLSTLKSDFTIQSALVNQRFEDTEKDIQEMKSDLRQIKDTMPKIENHISLVKDIGGGDHLVGLRDTVRSFTITKGLIIAAISSAVSGLATFFLS